MEQQGKEALVQGILADARNEVAAIAATSAKRIEKTLQEARAKVAAIRADAEKTVEKRMAVLSKTASSALLMEIRRSELEINEQITANTLKLAREKLAKEYATPEYAEGLSDRIAEGAMGLLGEHFIVDGSESDRALLTSDLFAKASVLVERHAGRKVFFEKAEEGANRLGRGVVISAVDGKTAFDNTVAARLTRYDNEARRMVYDRLYRRGNS